MRRRNTITKFVHIALIVLTVLSAMGLVCALLAQYISPSSTTFFAFFALGAPFLYLMSLLLLVMWVLKWRVILMVILLIPLLIGLWNLGDFVQVKWSEEMQSSSKKNSDITIVSYNTHRMGSFKGGTGRLSEICDALDSLSADVICLQEFMVRDSAELSIIDKLFDKYTYRVYQKDPHQSLSGYSGRVTLSKFPILESSNYKFEGTESGFLASSLIHNGDTLTLFNCHLQTTGVSQISKEESMMRIIESDDTRAQGGRMVESMAQNFRARAHQADSLAQEIELRDNRVIVIGDLNSPPLTYTYHQVSKNLNDSFRDGGSGYGSTFRPIKGIFRIDYILYNSENYKCIGYDSPEWNYSDHRPVIVKLRKL